MRLFWALLIAIPLFGQQGPPFVPSLSSGAASQGGAGNPCTSTAGAIQYDNAGNFGCANAVQNSDGSISASKAFDTNSATTYTWSSGTTTLDLSAGNFFTVTASGGNPVLAVNGDAHGSGPIWLQLINDTARTWTLPASFANGCVPPNAGTAISTLQAYLFDGTTWWGQGCTSSENGTFRGAEVSILTNTAPSGRGVAGFDSSAHLWCGQDNASGYWCTVPTGTSGDLVNYNASGYPQDSTVKPTAGVLTFIATPSGANFNAMIAAGGIPINCSGTCVKTAAYTTVLGDGGGTIIHSSADNNARTFTIDSNANVAFPLYTTIVFMNLVNTVTIAITSDTLTLAGTASTGSRTLAVNGVATAVKVGTTSWLISGPGLT